MKELSKRAFIRSVPDLSAAEVVEEGAKKGLKFTTGYVYVTRCNQRAHAGDEEDAKAMKRLEKIVEKVLARARRDLVAEFRRTL